MPVFVQTAEERMVCLQERRSRAGLPRPRTRYSLQWRREACPAARQADLVGWHLLDANRPPRPAVRAAAVPCLRGLALRRPEEGGEEERLEKERRTFGWREREHLWALIGINVAESGAFGDALRPPAVPPAGPALRLHRRAAAGLGLPAYACP